MRVLMLHNRYQFPGGEEAATEADVRLLHDHGHEVELLERDNREIERIGKINTGLRTVWSGNSYAQILKKLETSRYDILHVQNFFPLWSPSVYYAAARASVPVVQTLHNYRLMCVNSLLYRDNHVCEDCVGKAFPWPGILHACYRNSRAGSAVVASMIGVHRLLNTWRDKIAVYIAVSQFARDKCIGGGLPEEKILVRSNFLDPAPLPGEGGGGYALYVGRLSAEKGIMTALKAWQTAESPVPLTVVGEGPLSVEVAAAAQTSPAIQYVGRKSSNEVLELMRRAELLVFPSECYETMGRTILEAFAVGTPVLTSALGERASIVIRGETGFHFPPGDTVALKEQVEWCSRNLEQVRAMRRAARAAFEQKFTGRKSLEFLLNIYRRARAQQMRAGTSGSD
jgi:glycosyltransferase involved in cell wall biosynthesis